MLISVFLVWETTLIKFKSSFFPKARNNLPIIDRIIEDTRSYLAFIDFFSEIQAKEVPDFYVFFVGGSKFARTLETLGIQSLSFQDNSCYEKHNAKKIE